MTPTRNATRSVWLSVSSALQRHPIEQALTPFSMATQQLVMIREQKFWTQSRVKASSDGHPCKIRHNNLPSTLGNTATAGYNSTDLIPSKWMTWGRIARDHYFDAALEPCDITMYTSQWHEEVCIRAIQDWYNDIHQPVAWGGNVSRTRLVVCTVN